MISWNIKLLNSRSNDGFGISAGVAPFGIDQDDDDNYETSGWYLDFWTSELFSGPPHKYESKKYGPRKEDGEYVRTGDSIGVVMDTAKGELSFALNGVNLGVAYKGIPLDEPLVPCAILCAKDESVELVI